MILKAQQETPGVTIIIGAKFAFEITQDLVAQLSDDFMTETVHSPRYKKAGTEKDQLFM